MDPLTTLYLFSPLVLAGVIFLLITRYDLFPRLAIPINQRLFGKNKTWRAFALMPVVTGLMIELVSLVEPAGLTFRYSDYNGFLLGATLQIVFFLSELPNSMLKRHLSIPPGKRPKRHAWAFALLDALDAVPGAIIVLVLWTSLTLLTLLQLTLIAVALKFGMNYLLFLVGIRKEPV